MVISIPHSETAIFSYELDGEIETGGIVHNLLGIEYLTMDNDNIATTHGFLMRRQTMISTLVKGDRARFSQERFFINNHFR